jgi:Tol biopolymer transport system component
LNATICEIATGENRLIGWPIDSVSADGRWATTFSYGRLEKLMPGYGYAIGDDEADLEDNSPEGTGLYLIDLTKNERQMLVSLKQLSELQPEADMADTCHFVTHTEFSSDGRYVAFLHRWYKGTFKRTRLIVLDLQTRQMYVSPTSGMVSHYVWNAKNAIVAYCRMEDTDSHVFFSDPTMRQWKRCGYPQLNSDGHHHFIDDDTFVVDTYPDKYRHCKLWKVSVKSDEVTLLADVKSLKQFVNPDIDHNWKCDLHPRVSADGTLVSFDSTHTGRRSLCVMRIQ